VIYISTGIAPAPPSRSVVDRHADGFGGQTGRGDSITPIVYAATPHPLARPSARPARTCALDEPFAAPYTRRPGSMVHRISRAPGSCAVSESR